MNAVRLVKNMKSDLPAFLENSFLGEMLFEVWFWSKPRRLVLGKSTRKHSGYDSRINMRHHKSSHSQTRTWHSSRSKWAGPMPWDYVSRYLVAPPASCCGTAWCCFAQFGSQFCCFAGVLVWWGCAEKHQNLFLKALKSTHINTQT